jgi:hypothetical protein
MIEWFAANGWMVWAALYVAWLLMMVWALP